VTPRCYACTLVGVDEPATCLVQWQSVFDRGTVSEPACEVCAALLLSDDSSVRRLALPESIEPTRDTEPPASLDRYGGSQ
jgi:hypothetical protein